MRTVSVLLGLALLVGFAAIVPSASAHNYVCVGDQVCVALVLACEAAHLVTQNIPDLFPPPHSCTWQPACSDYTFLLRVCPYPPSSESLLP